MSNLLNLRLGVSDDPSARQPSLADCLAHVLAQCGVLADLVVEGLVQASAPAGPRRHPALQLPGVRQVVDALRADLPALRTALRDELEPLFYQGGGTDADPGDLLRFEDLQLLGDAELDRSIELARAQQEVARMVEDVLPRLDALVSTLLGWRSIQSGLNPLRPEVFIRALHSALWTRVPEGPVRDALILPAAGLLGAQLRRIYREIGDWLASTGVDPAVPAAGRRDAAAPGASGSPVSRSIARTLLTLERLRKLLAGDFDTTPGTPGEFLHTVPASMALLQDLQQEELLLRRLQEERAARGAGAPADPLATSAGTGASRIGQALGEQVVRLMFDNLVEDGRLVAAYKQQLRMLEPSVLALARDDSRFFSDRLHPGRRLLEAMTQRSLAFSVESDEGWTLFLAGVESAAAALAQRKPPQAEHFQGQLDRLQASWDAHDGAARHRREEAARALMHAEQRNLLAQRFSTEFAEAALQSAAPEFVVDFLRNAWAQAVAQSKLGCQDGSDDPMGLHALVKDLLWSVRQGPVRRPRQHRLAEMVPGLIARLREGLQAIGYPPELTERFLDRLAAIHGATLREGRDAGVRPAADEALAAPSEFGPGASDDPAVWIGQAEAQDCAYLGPDSVLPGSDTQAPGVLPAVGSWVELQVQGHWHRVQLTWASPHRTLFMFTSPRGAAHSVSLRTLRRLQSGGQVRLVAASNLVEEALDQVAREALRNSLGPDTPQA